MPFAGFYCDPIPVDTPLSVESCVKCAAGGALEGCNMTPPVLWGIAENMRPVDFGLSVTGLIGCSRKRVLQASHDYWLRPSAAWWSLRGTLMHQVIAAYAQADFSAIAETRFSMKIGDVTISGQPDLIDTRRNHLMDFKTTSRLPAPQRRYHCPHTGQLIRIGYHRNKYLECSACLDGKHVTKEVEALTDPQPKPAHVQQVSIYRLLLARNNIQIDTAEIIYMDMSGQLRMPVELIPLDEVEDWVRRRLEAFNLPAGDLPGVLTEPHETWECDYCPVRQTCEQLHGRPVGSRAGEAEDQKART